MKKTLSFILSLIMVFGILTSVPLTVNAASVDDLTFIWNQDYTGYIVYACNESAEGDLVIPETYDGVPVVGIGHYALGNCIGLTSVTIPDSVTSIDSYAFAFCSNLANVTIGNGVKSIGNTAFWSCTSLTEIKFPDSVTTIGESAFEMCTSLKSVTIPSSVTTIEDWAFASCESLEAVYISDIVAWCNIYFESCFSNPLYDAHNLYLNDELVTDLIIPEGITHIPDYAFEYCRSLVSVKIPDSVTSIGDRAFEECTNLASITIPDKVKSIGGYAFSNCESLASATIGKSVESIGEVAFNGCISLSSIVIPESVKSIGDSAFKYCPKLASIIIPDSVTYIGGSAFSECYNLSSISIPDSVTRIGDRAFIGTAYYSDRNNWENDALYVGKHIVMANSDALSGSFAIKDGTKTIADMAFEYCENLTSITIPDSVTNIGDDVFYGCEKISSIDVNTNNQSYSSQNDVLFNKDKTELVYYPIGNTNESYIIPETVTSIAKSAFRNCTSLVSITIPDGVESIGATSFYKCSGLSSVTIPDSVISIGRFAFYKCSGLTSVLIGNNVANVGEYAFCDCTSLSSVSLPESLISIGDDAFGKIEKGDLYAENIEGFIIYGIKNSEAESYANWNGIEFVEIKVECAHEEVEWVTDKEATCTENGQKSCYCLSCKEIIETEIVEAVGHILPEEWHINQSATCTENGWMTKSCLICKEEIESVTIEATGHSYPSEWTIDENPTCTEEGYKYKLCYNCGESTLWESIPAKGHLLSDWIVDVKPTVERVGKKHKECAICEKVIETAKIAQLKCSKPKMSKISNTEYGVKITWGKVSGADKYDVYRKTGSSGKYTKIGTTSKTYYTDKKASSGKKYYYYVKAVNEAGSSSASSSLSKLYLADTTLSTPKSTKSGITLKWKKVTGADGYMVYRKTGSGSYSKIATVKGSTKVTYTDKKAKKGKTYTYKIKVYKSKTYSAYSNAKKIKDKY